MKSSRLKKATGVLIAALALTASGCGSGANNSNENSGGQIVSPKLPGSSVASPTAGLTTGGEETGDLGTGGTATGGTSGDSGEQNPALIMHIINSTLN